MPEEYYHEHDNSEEMCRFEEFVAKVPINLSVIYRFHCCLECAYRIGPQDAKVSHA